MYSVLLLPLKLVLISVLSINDTFSCDGDGKRIRSDITSNITTTTTYFVSNYYELTVQGATQSITKYYYAGSQRIALRKDGTLSFLLGDHLGSASLVTDATGNNAITTMYKIWGEVRYSSGTLPTKFTFTGQYSYMENASTDSS